LYNRAKPPGWVAIDRGTPALEQSMMSLLRNHYRGDAHTLLRDLEAALQFASTDAYWSKQLLSLFDVFRFDRIVEWATKQQAKVKAQTETPSQPCEDRRERAEQIRANLEDNLRRERLKEEIREDWVKRYYPNDRGLGLRAWMALPDRARTSFYRQWANRQRTGSAFNAS
jgi:hypothetical protein